MTTEQQHLTLIQMGSDERIPQNAIGYVADLGNPSLRESVRLDRLQQLSRYVPDLVEQFRK